MCACIGERVASFVEKVWSGSDQATEKGNKIFRKRCKRNLEYNGNKYNNK